MLLRLIGVVITALQLKFMVLMKFVEFCTWSHMSFNIYIQCNLSNKNIHNLIFSDSYKKWLDLKVIIAVGKKLLKQDYENQKGAHTLIMERVKTVQN